VKNQHDGLPNLTRVRRKLFPARKRKENSFVTTVNYSFLPEAEVEYLEAVRFYEEQRTGLGDSLICEFERIIALVVEKPEAWRLSTHQELDVSDYLASRMPCSIVGQFHKSDFKPVAYTGFCQ
jgi:hypothetical protein